MSANSNPEPASDEQSIFWCRWIICGDCGCSTEIKNPDGVPDENDWDEFGKCLVCGSSQFAWNADEEVPDV